MCKKRHLEYDKCKVQGRARKLDLTAVRLVIKKSSEVCEGSTPMLYVVTQSVDTIHICDQTNSK